MKLCLFRKFRTGKYRDNTNLRYLSEEKDEMSLWFL